MTPLTGVLDASVVIGLAKGGIFNSLASLYAPLYIPEAVRDEVIGQGQGRAGVAELAQAIGAWVTVVDPDPQQVQSFAAPRSVADRQVLAVAQAKAVDHVLTSDNPLYREATHAGLTCLRATDVVVLLKDRGLITAVKPVLDRMRQHGFGIDDFIYNKALRAAGEGPAP